MFGWNERPTKVECKHRIGGEKPARIFEIGKYKINVPDDPEEPISYTVPTYSNRNSGDDLKAALPNLEVTDGCLKFPLEDLVPLVLSRVPPEELAQALWSDEDVREAFIYAATERYSEMGIGDADRRKLLKGLQQAIFSTAIDLAVNKLSNLESRFGNKWFFWNQVADANRVLENMVPECTYRLKDGDSDEQFRITGTNWKEARDHWRAEIMAMLSASAEPEEPIEGDDVP